MKWQVWRHDGYSWATASTHRWRWWARLVAWERQNRGWFRYTVTRVGELPQ